MRSSSRVLRLAVLVPALMVAVASWAADVAPVVAQPAQWVSRKINFTYVGIVTKYSCDGLVGYLQQVLLVLGARKEDMDIHATGCTAAAGETELSPGVAGTFSVLVSAPAGSVGGVPAAWSRVNVTADPSYCELLEQVGQKVLPLFTARNAQFSVNCLVLAQVGTQRLTAEVLAPVSAEPAKP